MANLNIKEIVEWIIEEAKDKASDNIAVIDEGEIVKEFGVEHGWLQSHGPEIYHECDRHTEVLDSLIYTGNDRDYWSIQLTIDKEQNKIPDNADRKRYEKYRLLWMLDHEHSIKEMIDRLQNIQEEDERMSGERPSVEECFAQFECETGFAGADIWSGINEWRDRDQDYEDGCFT